MAKKAKTTETPTAKMDIKNESVKKRIIVANISVPLRKTTSLDVKHIVGKMAVGTAYEIKRECTSKIYGDFYQLTNGYYISKSECGSNYSIF